MKYSKPPLTFEDQADLLISRGMTGDRNDIISRLSAVNYYRLSGYWHTFRKLPEQMFRDGTTFEKVWKRYAFDRHLRLLVMDAVERVEIAIRTQLAYHHAHTYKNSFAYAEDPLSTPGWDQEKRDRFLDILANEMKTSKETFVDHFRSKYGAAHVFMPIWMAAEIMTFGQMLTLFRGSSPQIKHAVASTLGIHDTVAESWLLMLNTIRNICAHHGRLWNRGLGVKPKIPKRDPQWHTPVLVANDRMFGVLTILKYCLDYIAPQSAWPKRFTELIGTFPNIPLTSMGFPKNWERCPIWK